MTRPWDDEQTPTTKQAVIDSHGHWTFELRDRMAEIERRMRHAERLLELSVKTHGIGFVTGKMEKHLEAARQEDA